MVSLSVTYTAFAGYMIAGGIMSINLFAVLLGVFFLSSGASAINHLLEFKTDALMHRTRNRPLPTGRISHKFALLFALICSLTGIFLLGMYSSMMVVLLGIFNLIWYDFIYTPLKKKTVWAVFVGTITGVIPFYMGYLSATEQLPNYRANFIAFYLLIWQIPHFFLLLGIYGKEYEAAGLASVTRKTSDYTLFVLSVFWIAICCVVSVSFPAFGISHYKTSGYIIIAVSLIVLSISIILTGIKRKRKHKLLFILSNLMQVFILTTLIIDSMIRN
jgi:heme o synthase